MSAPLRESKDALAAAQELLNGMAAMLDSVKDWDGRPDVRNKILHAQATVQHALTQQIERPPAGEDWVEMARSDYQDDGRIEIDDDAVASEVGLARQHMTANAQTGKWVAAWVWVPGDEKGPYKED